MVKTEVRRRSLRPATTRLSSDGVDIRPSRRRARAPGWSARRVVLDWGDRLVLCVCARLPRFYADGRSPKWTMPPPGRQLALHIVTLVGIDPPAAGILGVLTVERRKS